jgi:HD domain
LNLPDTALSREAHGILSRAAPPELVNHSVRAYLLGKAYGRKMGISFDDEGLYLAALFHDLGLCPAFKDTRFPFQVNSGRALRDFLLGRGVAQERAGALTAAVDFHMQLLPRWSEGNVAGLLQVGAWMDITRLRRRAVKDEVSAVEKIYPRLKIERKFVGMLLGSVGSVGSCLGWVVPPRGGRPR